jgi:XcyI restriction endonuclease
VAISVPVPQLQIDFAFALEQIRAMYLQEALSEAVARLNISAIDAELAKFAPAPSLTMLARHGLRGELMFALPSILRSSPRLLGYYRLLLGFSQKAFYTSQSGLSGFRSMEDKGSINTKQQGLQIELCKALAAASATLIEGIGARRMSRELLHDLALLTVGPQLRGGFNVKIGLAGIVKVFDAVSAIVSKAAVRIDPNAIEIRNAAGRLVLIEFASDPDIVIREEIAEGAFRNIIAIEVKGGMDFSNIHNRIGEAEKSHQKAKSKGYVECWTVVNVDRMNLAMARKESPTTNRFYLLSQIDNRSGDSYQDFHDRIVSLTGIVKRPVGKRRK